MFSSRRLVAIGLTALALLVPAAGAGAASSSSAAAPTTVVPEVSSLVKTVLDNYAGDNDRPTQRYYAGGVWHNSDNAQNWADTQGGAALAAASRWSATGRTDSALLRKAIDTITTAIATGQNGDGSFSTPPAAAVGPWGAGVSTEFFARAFGDTYLVVQSALTPAQRQQWVASLTRAADFLIDDKDVEFYANGNVNLGYAQTLYLAWRASGQARFAYAYNSQMDFVINPDQTKWPGYGLRLTKAPTRTDGADGAGYLAEKGLTGPPGFDPEYTMVSLSEATDLYALSRDPRALRLANLLLNVLRPRISDSMALDTSGGSRHADAGRTVAFTSSAPVVLYWLAGRTDLADMASRYVDGATRTFTVSLAWASNPVFYEALGVDVAGMLRATGPTAVAMTQQLGKSGTARASGRTAPRRPQRAHRSHRRSHRAHGAHRAHRV